MTQADKLLALTERARIKRIAFLNEQRHNTKRWQLRRRRYLLR